MLGGFFGFWFAQLVLVSSLHKIFYTVIFVCFDFINSSGWLLLLDLLIIALFYNVCL